MKVLDVWIDCKCSFVVAMGWTMVTVGLSGASTSVSIVASFEPDEMFRFKPQEAWWCLMRSQLCDLPSSWSAIAVAWKRTWWIMKATSKVQEFPGWLDVGVITPLLLLLWSFMNPYYHCLFSCIKFTIVVLSKQLRPNLRKHLPKISDLCPSVELEITYPILQQPQSLVQDVV